MAKGDRAFRSVVEHLRCGRCGGHPAPVYLVASHHRTGKPMGAPGDWAVELVGPDRGPGS
jgi:hypothetical protein